MECSSDPITRYSSTQRIVLLVDLDPLLLNPDLTKPFLSHIQTLLSFPPLSSSLFSFKPFFSSLSPLLSSSKLPFPTPSLSFDTPSHTLLSLSHTLSSLPLLPPHPLSPTASNISSSLSQLLHHYPLDPLTPLPIPHNLVLLFSPSFSSLSSSFHPHLSSPTSFSNTFSSLFCNVSRAFASRGIHCSWITVNSTHDDSEILRLFRTGVRRLGWGFSSLDSLLLGSALVPFGLVYPQIGLSWGSVSCSSRDFRAQFSLAILDVNGKPIEYNCCELEFVDFRVSGGYDDIGVDLGNLQSGGCGRKGRLWEICLEGNVKLEVKIVKKSDAFVNLGECLSDSVLVREVVEESKKKCTGTSDKFFADRVLELVAAEFGCQWQPKSVPAWEMILSFLYREGLWALVSVTNAKGFSCMGILRPFTVFAALFSVLGDPLLNCDFGEVNVAQYVRMVDGEINISDWKFNKNGDLLDSQAKKSAAATKGHEKRKMMDLNSIRNMTWSLFCDSVYDQFETDLHEVYYAGECNKSKKLKFLKCWMKQMKKSGFWDLTLLEKLRSSPTVEEVVHSKLNDLPENGEQPNSSFVSADIKPEPEAPTIKDEAVLDFRSESETSEAFFSNLSNKINLGIESEVIDLAALAERLVTSSIYWLRQKVDGENLSQNHSPLKGNDTCGGMIASELIKILLRDPKEIIAKHRSQKSFSQALDDSEPATLNTEHVVREYELQILFRMEILQSEVGNGIENSIKHKFVKQICLLLENIQCRMGGGFFGDWNLENYVVKIIKNRYSLTLEDVVQKIYTKMDLLLFDDDDEAPNSLLNSEDSNKSLTKRAYRDEVGENDVSNEPVSSENEHFQLKRDDSSRFQRITETDHNRKLIEAKQRRERARRFSSFTSWMPDLQRVWAPKQKGMKLKTDPFRKMPKRKEQQRTSYGAVCETPMTGNKRSSPWTTVSDDESLLADRSPTSGSVSKALFKNDV